jgi:lactate dehydrogenase-like 2-hydroxyacid dehydrogenase
MVKIAVVNSTSFGRVFPEHWSALEKLGQVRRVSLPSDVKGAVLAKALKGSTAIIAGVNPRFSGDFFERMGPSLKLIARHGIGYDNVDLRAAALHGVTVTRVPGPLEREAVAEHTLALLLACLRKIPQAREAVQKGQWLKRLEFRGSEIKGKTAGILGLGNIGSCSAEILSKGFKARVIAYDPKVSPALARRRHANRVPFNRVLADSDILLLHCSLNAGNRGFINARALAKMKKGVVIVNTARGELVDTAALVKALRSGRVAAFGADVVEGEPLTRKNHPLLNMENACLVPHIAAYTLESMKAMGDKCVADVADVVQGRRPKEIVNSSK